MWQRKVLWSFDQDRECFRPLLRREVDRSKLAERKATFGLRILLQVVSHMPLMFHFGTDI
jgi:hypothetical protein